MLWAARLAVLALLAVVLPTTSPHAQAPGYVNVKLVEAGLMVGAGGGSGVLTYRGRDYPSWLPAAPFSAKRGPVGAP